MAAFVKALVCTSLKCLSDHHDNVASETHLPMAELGEAVSHNLCDFPEQSAIPAVFIDWPGQVNTSKGDCQKVGTVILVCTSQHNETTKM